ncbi:TIGR02679 domain-containing protein [Acetobacterium sp. KB-1]|jgi:uncharacterized protein (TIGR02679 family)|nr:TIGR02679 domain-containing protein [Acetobacterium sp. KB-1]AWW27175.1 hypothetical protein DOZ58_11360 [Acetobacterium sp. KB-1]
MMPDEFAAYLKDSPGYRRIIKQIREKYESLGHLGGTIYLDKISDDERAVLRSLFKKNYLQKSASFSVEKFIKAFESTRYRGSDFEAVLSCYYGEKLSWKKDVRSQYQDQKGQYFEDIIKLFKETPAGLWLEAVLVNKNNAYSLLNLKYNEDPEYLRSLLTQVCQGLNQSVTETEKVRLALFASQVTKDPHAFDMNRDGGRLLLYALASYYKLSYPQNAEAQMELLYQAGLIYDEVSNYTICRGIQAYAGDKIHSGWAGFANCSEPLHVSLWNIGMIDRVTCVNKRVFVFENPTVFSEVAGLLENQPAALICSAGNVKVASLLLLDKIAQSGSDIYYSGDFDPEGLAIADKLKKRYGEKLILWHFTPESYQKIQSKKMISAARLKKLEKIEAPELIRLAQAIKKSGYSGYQEMMVDIYLQDILRG